MAVIAVSREYGSCGEAIAKQVAKEFGYSYFGKETLADVVRVSHKTESQHEQPNEQAEADFLNLLRKLFVPDFSHLTELSYYPSSSKKIRIPASQLILEESDRALAFIHHVVEKLWERGDVVIIGRGSQIVLAEKPNTLHVRFIASIADCSKRIMEQDGVTFSDALIKIGETDKQRAHYLKHYHDADWSDPQHYDLVINTSSMGVKQAVEVIIAATRHQEIKQTWVLWPRFFIPAKRLREFLDRHNVRYVNIIHSAAYTAQEVAESAHIPGHQLAKTVIIKINDRMAMVVLPAPDKVDFGGFKAIAGASQVELASEAEFKHMFPECEVGAMPPFGNLYGMAVFVTQCLTESEEIAFNAGSHTELIQLAYQDFERLVKPTMIRSPAAHPS